jgi:AraC-like DNA-binding protein
MHRASIERAKLFIEKNIEKQLSLEEVSRESGMSKYHFSRTFKAVTGNTFKTYHNQRRIEAAKTLLRNQETRVTDACYEVGFKDISYFNRVFRRVEGMSPSAYQKKFQRGNT